MEETQKISAEVALLIASAQGKGINVTIWLAEGSQDGKIPVIDFCNKLVSLGLVVGVQEDAYTKKQLELATSKTSLRSIQSICAERNANGAIVVDVEKFLKLCNCTYNDINEENFDQDSSDEYFVPDNKSSKQNYRYQYTDEAAEEYIEDAKQWAKEGVARPISAPAGQSGRIPQPQRVINGGDYSDGINKDYNIEDDEDYLYERATRHGWNTDGEELNDADKIDYDSPEKEEGDKEANPISVNNENEDFQESGNTIAKYYATSVSNQHSKSAPIPVQAPVKIPSSLPEQQRTVPKIETAVSLDSGKIESKKTDSRPVVLSLAERLDRVVGHHKRAESTGRMQRSNSASLPSHSIISESVAIESSKQRHSTPNKIPASRASSASKARLSSGRSWIAQSHSSTLPKRWEVDDPDRLSVLQKEVEQNVLNCVLQTDLYHIVQVHLGLIDSYTMIPARGKIISSNKRQWLTCKELQAAFVAARLRLNDTHVFVLMKLVKEFAQLSLAKKGVVPGSITPLLKSGENHTMPCPVDATRECTDENQPNPNEQPAATECTTRVETNKQVDDSRIVQHGKLSADWISKYMIYLRVLTTAKARAEKKKQHALKMHPMSATRASTNMSNEEASESVNIGNINRLQSTDTMNDNESEYILGVGWKDWMNQKKSAGLKQSTNRSREFRLALTGQSHNLSKMQIEKFIDQLNIIPNEILSTVIDNKIKIWKLDVDGRGDFHHKLNFEITKFQRENPEGKNWNRLPEKQKQEIISKLTKLTCSTKKQEMLIQETSTGSITKELFWLYDKFCRDCGYRAKDGTWGTWLQDFINRQQPTQIRQFQQKSEEQRKARTQNLVASKTVAALNEVEQMLTAAAKSMSTVHGIEIRKSLIELKRVAHDRGQGKGAVVLKADYDKVLQRVLQPRAKDLPADLRKLTVADTLPASSSSSSANNKSNNQQPEKIFVADEEEAVSRVVKTDTEKAERDTEIFDMWKRKKLEQKLKEAADEKLQKEESDKLRIKKEKLANKAYRQWLKTHKKSQYISKVDGKPHPIPSTNQVKHDTSWRAET